MGLRRWIKPVLGPLVFVALATHLGWSAMRDAIVSVGLWFAVVAMIDVAGMTCDAAAIREFAARRTSLRNAFVAQASGYVLNRMTPGSTLGEPLKVMRLAREAPRDIAVSAIVLYNIATFGVGVVVIVIGAPMAVFALDLPGSLVTAVWIALAVLVVGLVALVALMRRGLVGMLIGAARRMRAISAERETRWRAKTASIDAHLGDARWRTGVLFVFASRLTEQLGTLILLHALGAPFSGYLAIAFLALGILISWISNLMPLGLGIADTGHYTLFALLGAPATLGIAFAMVERARACVLSLFGAAAGGFVLTDVSRARTVPAPSATA